jgi:tRNA nucleotidyltransferase/poly(A) polymerase
MKVYIVGGAVRDMLLGVKPKDFDYVVVGATEKDMLERGYIKVGADFPVFLHPETNNEYALARTERKTGNGYLGFTVDASPTVTLEEDLLRRDLTINAMAMDEQGNIIDPYGGQEDLKNGILRHVSDAFKEDPLRVLRLARFCARYYYEGFEIHPTTMDLAVNIVDAGELNHLPAERFVAEFYKVFEGTDPHIFFQQMYKMHCFDNIKFFKDTFGTVEMTTGTRRSILEISGFARRLGGENAYITEFKIRAFIALCATDPRYFNNEVRDLFRDYKYFNELDKKIPVHDLFNLLRRLKAWNPDQYKCGQFIEFVEWVNNTFEEVKHPYTALQILRGLHHSEGVKAKDFPELEGKELGNALDSKRKDKIFESLDSHGYFAQVSV